MTDPPDSTGNPSGSERSKPVWDEKRMELTEHLGELRSRILRSLLYLIVGATLAYQFFSPLYGLLYKPLQQEMQRQNNLSTARFQPYGFNLPPATHDPITKAEYDNLARAIVFLRDHPTSAQVMSIVFRNFHEPFLVRLKISIIYGFLLVMPLVIWELALFIAPALTPTERKPLRLLIPISVLLLVFGVAVAYKTMFYAMHWFLSYLADFPQPAVLMQDPNDYVLFFVKMMAAFGIAFQLPVVLMAMAWAGLVTSKGILKNWRWGVVIAVLGGVFTPSNDLPSMLLMSIPLLILYFLSAALVLVVERIKARQQHAPGT